MRSTLRSGCVAILTFLFAASYLAQTDPRMIVSWDPIQPPAGQTVARYIIETTVGTLPYTKAADCPAIPCTVEGIEGTSTYKIRVAGVEPNGTVGEYSDPITFLFASIQPLSPTSLSHAAATSTQPGKLARKLTWTAVKGFRTRTFPAGTVVSYRVYQAGTSGSSFMGTTQTPTFTAQGLSKHKTYHFYVTAVVNGIESFSSPAVRVNT